MYATDLNAHDHTTTPDEPAFVGQSITCGAEFPHLPDGTVALSWDGRTWRVATDYRGNRVVVVQRKDGGSHAYPISTYADLCGDSLESFQIRVVFVPSDI